MRSESEILADCREAACEVWSAIAVDLDGLEGVDENEEQEFVTEMVFDCDRVYRLNESWLPEDAIARLKSMKQKEKLWLCEGIA